MKFPLYHRKDVDKMLDPGCVFFFNHKHNSHVTVSYIVSYSRDALMLDCRQTFRENNHTNPSNGNEMNNLPESDLATSSLFDI